MKVAQKPICNDVTITSKIDVEWIVEKLQSTVSEKRKATIEKQLTKYARLFAK